MRSKTRIFTEKYIDKNREMRYNKICMYFWEKRFEISCKAKAM